jgi:predicted outer membrane repeat protein
MGGAILATQVSVVKACGSVKDNSANGHGGGIASIGDASLLLCQGAALRSNSAGGNGGCVYAAGASTSFGELKDIMRTHFQPTCDNRGRHCFEPSVAISNIHHSLKPNHD